MSDRTSENPKMIQAILMTVERRTEGKGSRYVTQVFTLEGEFLGENDTSICDMCRKYDGAIRQFCGSDHK